MEMNDRIRELTSIIKALADQITSTSSSTERNTPMNRDKIHMMMLIVPRCVVLTHPGKVE